MLAKYFLAIGNFSTVRLDLEYHRFLRCPLVRYHSNVMEINTHAPTREKCVEIIKTLHVKFFPFGSVEPARSVSVKRPTMSQEDTVPCQKDQHPNQLIKQQCMQQQLISK